MNWNITKYTIRVSTFFNSGVKSCVNKTNCILILYSFYIVGDKNPSYFLSCTEWRSKDQKIPTEKRKRKKGCKSQRNNRLFLLVFSFLVVKICVMCRANLTHARTHETHKNYMLTQFPCKSGTHFAASNCCFQLFLVKQLSLHILINIFRVRFATLNSCILQVTSSVLRII